MHAGATSGRTGCTSHRLAAGAAREGDRRRRGRGCGRGDATAAVAYHAVDQLDEGHAHVAPLLLVLFNARCDPYLEALVKGHDGDVDDVHEEQHGGLPHGDLEVVGDENDNHREREAVVRAVARERPPRERQVGLGEGAARDDEEHVEDGRADDGTEADVRPGDEEAKEGGSQLGRRAARRHPRRARHVVLQVHRLADGRERCLEEGVAHDGQAEEHVERDRELEDDGARRLLWQLEAEVRIRRVLDQHLGWAHRVPDWGAGNCLQLAPVDVQVLKACDGELGAADWADTAGDLCLRSQVAALRQRAQPTQQCRRYSHP